MGGGGMDGEEVVCEWWQVWVWRLCSMVTAARGLGGCIASPVRVSRRMVDW